MAFFSFQDLAFLIILDLATPLDNPAPDGASIHLIPWDYVGSAVSSSTIWISIKRDELNLNLIIHHLTFLQSRWITSDFSLLSSFSSVLDRPPMLESSKFEFDLKYWENFIEKSEMTSDKFFILNSNLEFRTKI